MKYHSRAERNNVKRKDIEWKSSQFHISAEMNALVPSRKYAKIALFQVLSTVFGY